MMVAARRASRDDGAGNDAGGDGEGTATRRKNGRYLIAADRCYCFVSTSPFFSLHFQVLHAVLGMERLERIRACVEQMMVEEEESDEESNEESNEESETRDGIAASTTDADADAAAAAVSPLIGRRLSFESGGATGDPARAGFGSPVETSSREANTTTVTQRAHRPDGRDALPRVRRAPHFDGVPRVAPAGAGTVHHRFAAARHQTHHVHASRPGRVHRFACEGWGGFRGWTRAIERVGSADARARARGGGRVPPRHARRDPRGGFQHEPTWKSPSVSRARRRRRVSVAPLGGFRREEASHLETWTVATSS